jgi:hypothetical protein
MAHILGLNGYAYYNTGSNATPAWVLIDNIMDVSLSFTKETTDITVRGGGGYTLKVGTLKDFSVSFGMVYDTDETSFLYVKDAFIDNTIVQYAFCDGPIATVGTEGFKAYCDITNFSRNESLRDAFKVDTELSAAYFVEGGSIIPPTDFETV